MTGPAFALPVARLRSDLTVSRQQTATAPVFIAKDPQTGRFFRFREIEGFILETLDGAISLDTIRARVEEKFGASLPAATLEQFIHKVRSLGLLEHPAASPPPTRSPGRVQGSILYLRVKAFDPDRLFAYLVGGIRFCFTPSFVLMSSAAIALAALVTAANWTEIQRDLPRLYTAQSLVLAYLTVLLVITAHEFAHGLTCKFHGGSVREVGFLLLFFQPAFYCNVSDAWLFPEKSRRLWVTFAGAYCEVFLWALATLVWRVTDPYTVINYLALVVMATSGIKTLFNLNPLIKLDGYYLLSDYLDIPNLRAKALGYLGGLVRRVWGSAVPGVLDLTARERRIYLIYGLLAWTYSLWLLGFIAVRLGEFLTTRYQAWGFILFALLVGAVIQRPLRHLVPAPRSFSMVRAQSTLWYWIKWLLRTAVLGGLVAALFLIRTDLRIPGSFTVLPVHNADVRAEVEGILQAIYVDEGDEVKKGAPIATLGARDYRAELHKIKAEVVEKQARLKLLQAGARAEEIEMTRTLVAKAEQRSEYAARRVEMDQALFDKGLLARREFEDIQETASLRAKELQEARDKLQLLLAGSRPEEVDAVAAEISRLEAQDQYVNEQLRLLKVLSPITGIVATQKLKDRIGQAVKKGDLIAKVYDMRTVTVEIAVPEEEIADVHVGQKTVLTARAYPQTRFQGTVASIAPIATNPDDSRAARTVRVTTQLDNRAMLLKPQMTGEAKLYGPQQRLIDLATRRLVRFLKVEFWSWW